MSREPKQVPFLLLGKESIVADTTVRFKPEMAEKFGVNAAIVAQLMKRETTKEEGEILC